MSGIDPGEGYRLVKIGEKILAGDEYYIGRIWCPDFADAVGDIQDGSSRYLPRRRKITSKRVEVTDNYQQGDIAVAVTGAEYKLDRDLDILVDYHYVCADSFKSLGIKVYRDEKPKELIAYRQTMIADGSAEGLHVERFESGDILWISNKKPLTFEED